MKMIPLPCKTLKNEIEFIKLNIPYLIMTKKGQLGNIFKSYIHFETKYFWLIKN